MTGGTGQRVSRFSAYPPSCDAAFSLTCPLYRAPERVAGLVLVAPALPTNDPKNSWSTGGGLGRKLRFAAVRAILQVPIPC